MDLLFASFNPSHSINGQVSCITISKDTNYLAVAFTSGIIHLYSTTLELVIHTLLSRIIAQFITHVSSNFVR